MIVNYVKTVKLDTREIAILKQAYNVLDELFNETENKKLIDVIVGLDELITENEN